MQIYEINGKRPQIDPNVAYIAEDVKIIGDVVIEEGVTIFNGVIIEGYPIKIRIKKFSNIQSGTVIHGLKEIETIIGEYNTIGHRCVIHGCQLGKNVTVGLGSIVMGKTIIGDGCFIGAGSLITQGKNFPPNSLIYGSPAKVVKKLTEKDYQNAMDIAMMYYEEGKELAKSLRKIS
ncbi:MAG: gamma carbonic anhydrase family protein [Promethearchaeota archaeon]